MKVDGRLHLDYEDYCLLRLAYNQGFSDGQHTNEYHVANNFGNVMEIYFNGIDDRGQCEMVKADVH